MRLNPVALMALILLVILTSVFTLLAVIKTNAVRRYTLGVNEDGEKFDSNDKRRKEAQDAEARIRANLEGVAAREREVHRLNLALLAQAVYWSEDGQQLSGIATPAEQTATVRGQQVQLKQSAWKLTGDMVDYQGKRLDNWKAMAGSPERQQNPALEASIRTRQDDLQKVLTRISDQEAGFNKARDELNRKLEELKVAREKFEKQQREEYSTRATKVAQLEDRIRELLELDVKWVADLDADAGILEVAGDRVILDRGARQGLRPGLLFAVFAIERGKMVPKGMVETVEVSQDIAHCRVVSENEPRRNPIARGDQVGNPVWEAGKAKVFFLAGDSIRYNKEDIANFIRNAGGVVSPTLGPGCDYVVAGDRAVRDLALARQFQVQAMSEDYLLHFVQPHFAPKPDKK